MPQRLFTTFLLLSALLPVAWAEDETLIRMRGFEKPGETMSWEVEHIATFYEAPNACHFTTRILLRNSGSSPETVKRIRLIMPDETDSIFWELKQALPLPAHGESSATLYTEEKAPLELVMVYDGARFPLQPSDPKTDWDFGTDDTPAIQWQATFRNPFPAPLPPGMMTVMRISAKQAPNYLGRVFLPFLRAAEEVTLDMGRVANLSGRRIRSAYQEITPGKLAEESILITLFNQTAVEQTIHVQEQMFRGGMAVILEADERYQSTAPGRILFRVRVNPFSQKNIHYTVRYTW